MTTTPSIISSSKPIPQIFTNSNQFTTKKEKLKCTPGVKRCPPTPQYKSTTKVGRLSYSFNGSNDSRIDNRAQTVSFNRDNQLQLSRLYDENSNDSYFKQCFIIEEKIGSGSFGDVFKVKSRDDDRYYAVKVSREKFKGKSDREEKLNEVFKHEQLPRHDNLVTLYRAWEEKKRLYIQTELCSTSLSTLAEDNHEISEDVVWRYLVDLLKAINHLHSNNLIHLDIKPDNIFISRYDICKLGDFGLVVDIKNRHNMYITEGDPKYLAQELMQGIYTKSADIFSLGITILELATDLDLPSHGQGWHLLRSGKIPDHIFTRRKKEISNDLKSIITLMIHPNHEMRPTAQELLEHPFIAKFEAIRSKEVRLKKLQAKIEHLKSYCTSIWFRFIGYLNWAVSPVLHQLSIYFPTKRVEVNTPRASLNSSPINYNRTYVSNYLDKYSDTEDDFSNLNASNTSWLSNEKENFLSFQDHISSKNLCSTAYHNTHIPSTQRLSVLDPEQSFDSRSLKSATQRLTFEDISSDEMEMTENEEENNDILQNKHENSIPHSSSSPLQSDLISSVNNEYQLRNRKIFLSTKKNLSKTFNDLKDG